MPSVCITRTSRPTPKCGIDPSVSQYSASHARSCGSLGSPFAPSIGSSFACFVSNWICFVDFYLQSVRSTCFLSRSSNRDKVLNLPQVKQAEPQCSFSRYSPGMKEAAPAEFFSAVQLLGALEFCQAARQQSSAAFSL